MQLLKTIGDRIKARREELSLSQEQLAEALEVSQGSIWKWETGQVTDIRKINKIAKVLKTTVDYLETGEGEMEPAQELRENTAIFSHSIQGNPPTLSSQVKSSVPVYGPAAAGSSDSILLTDEYIREHMTPPPKELLNVRDGFVMIVAGDSMRPKYRPNQAVSVHPHRRPSVIEEDCVVVMEEDGNALLKEFAGETETEYKLRQFNPPKVLKIKKSEIRAIYAVIGRPSP